MCKIALLVASLVCAAHGSPLQSSKQASESLALLLLTHESGAAFHPSGSTLGHSNPSSCIGHCSDTRAQVRAQSLGEKAYGAVGEVGNLLSEGEYGVSSRDTGVANAIKKIEKDAAMLEISATARPQLAPVEIGVLTSLVGISFGAPYALSGKIVEVLVPTMGALAATVGFSAEYNGKAAVAKGKEIAAMTLQAAAEAESFLSQAERVKSIIPLCVGVSAAIAAGALLVPDLLKVLKQKEILQFMTTQIILTPPIVCIICALVAALSNQETKTLANRARSLGAGRFSAAKEVSHTWLSASEMIARDTLKARRMWINFAKVTLFAPAITCLFFWTKALTGKAVVCSAIAAAQSHYYLVKAEQSLSDATEAVATKTRSAAISDTYANQGMRSGSVLPFTSALCGFCAAATVAAVEFLPYCGGPVGESLLCLLFPTLGASVAAAASISKARAEVDAEAAVAAATMLAETRELETSGPIKGTLNLCALTIRNACRALHQSSRKVGNIATLGLFWRDPKPARAF